MSNHMWVSLVYFPVDIEEKEDGTLSISASELALEISADEALMGCFHCEEPLTVETFKTECTPQN